MLHQNLVIGPCPACLSNLPVTAVIPPKAPCFSSPPPSRPSTHMLAVAKAGHESMTHLHGDGAGGQGLVLQGVEVKAAVFQADPRVSVASLLLVDGKHQASLQLSSGGLSQATEVLSLQGVRRLLKAGPGLPAPSLLLMSVGVKATTPPQRKVIT